ncbi:hypothetical protein E3N88_38044 [Mikania micrantha]|uniref:RRM domain-containing protein n=1 Tax=Mikania micrantha TaxID=192012 RepID=A0A5N6LSV1_9ASTR|nr:hypothetical protein E3N88_38044 [Mikania micrantha]
MEDGDWEEVRWKKKENSRVANNRLFHREITFFVSNLPEGISDDRFREIFKIYGLLSDAYLARKRDRKGNIFGFVQFKDVKDIGKLISELNRIKLDGAKLGVNIARFNKDGKRFVIPPPSLHRSAVNSASAHGSVPNQNVFTSGQHHGSFRDALLGQKQKRRCTLPSFDPAIPKWWKGCTLIDMKEALLDKWFNSIEMWNGQDCNQERVASCRIYGMPISLWDSRFFSIIGENFGHVLMQPSTSVKDCNLTYVNIVILTKSFDRIREHLDVWKDRCFPIFINEEEDDWSPSFIVRSSDTSGGVMDQSKVASDHGGGAGELNSHGNDDAREEGEIVEENNTVMFSNVHGKRNNTAPDALNGVPPIGPIDFNSDYEVESGENQVSDACVPLSDGLSSLPPDLNFPPPFPTPAIRTRRLSNPRMGVPRMVGKSTLGIFNKLGVNKGNNFLHVFGTVMGVERNVNVVNIYAPQDVVSRRLLWNSLIDLMGDSDGLWILLGDFNEVRCSSERLNSVMDARGVADFNEFIYLARLNEYRMGGSKFTYMSTDGVKFSKIDRFLVCDQFHHRWPGATVTALPRLWSDHSPISLVTKAMDFGPPPFKFYSSWLQLEGIDNIVHSAMGMDTGLVDPVAHLMCKLRLIKSKLKEWRAELVESQNDHYNSLLKDCLQFESLAEMGFISERERELWLRYVQQYGVDFGEVFAPVARIETVRLILAVAAQNGWWIHHMDVKSAFLHGDLKELVAWNIKLDGVLKHLGFVKCKHEPTVYRKGQKEETLIIGVYVDDLLITGGCSEKIREIKKNMEEKFEMTDLGLLSYYLGIQVTQSDQGIKLQQTGYANKILDEAGLRDCNPTKYPMEPGLKLSKEDESEDADATQFRKWIGCLRYLTHTRPDLTYAVGDSSYSADRDDGKSTTGMVFFYGTRPIAWNSQKQATVALSSCEAEFMVASAAACQAIWLRGLLAEITGKEEAQVEIKVDNKSAIALIRNPVFHGLSKHIDTRYHFIRESVEKEQIRIEYVSGDEQKADILTKALPRIKLEEMKIKLGLKEVTSLGGPTSLEEKRELECCIGDIKNGSYGNGKDHWRWLEDATGIFNTRSIRKLCVLKDSTVGALIISGKEEEQIQFSQKSRVSLKFHKDSSTSIQKLDRGDASSRGRGRGSYRGRGRSTGGRGRPKNSQPPIPPNGQSAGYQQMDGQGTYVRTDNPSIDSATVEAMVEQLVNKANTGYEAACLNSETGITKSYDFLTTDPHPFIRFSTFTPEKSTAPTPSDPTVSHSSPNSHPVLSDKWARNTAVYTRNKHTAPTAHPIQTSSAPTPPVVY